MDNIYIALIGDIVDSKKITERKEVHKTLQSTINKINKKYSKHIVSKFLITLGDEFQGLLRPDAPWYEITTEIVESVHTVQIRFGIGYGSLKTPIKTKALGMDGPAFHAARKALELAHKKRGHAIVFEAAEQRLEISDHDAFNSMLELITVVRKLWNDKFLKIVPYLRQEMTQQNIAQKLQVSQPYISELIKEAYWKEFREAEDFFTGMTKKLK